MSKAEEQRPHAPRPIGAASKTHQGLVSVHGKSGLVSGTSVPVCAWVPCHPQQGWDILEQQLSRFLAKVQVGRHRRRALSTCGGSDSPFSWDSLPSSSLTATLAAPEPRLLAANRTQGVGPSHLHLGLARLTLLAPPAPQH